MDQAETEETFLTVAEVAEVLKLNQQTVRNWIDQGSLPALRVGRRVRIKRSDFDRILEESYSGSTTPAGVDQAPAAGRAPAGARTAAGDQTSSAEPTPSAEDFWGGEPVGFPDPAPGQAPASDTASAPGTAPAPGSTSTAGSASAPGTSSAPHSHHNGQSR